MMKEKQIIKEAEEMKNKQFTYDLKGKLMVINPLKYDALNANNVFTMRYSVADPIIEEPLFKSQKSKFKTSTNDFAALKPMKTIPKKEQE